MALSNLAARVIFAVIAIPIVLLLVYLGGLPLAILLAAAAGRAAWEYYGIAEAAGARPMAITGTMISAAIPLAVYGYQIGSFHPPVLTLAATITLIVFALAIWWRGVDENPTAAVATTLFGAAYTGGMLSFAYGLRYHNYAVGAAAGLALVLYPLLLTWTSDTAAYFVGRALGKRKLIPSVSPGKTVAGAVGALVASVVVSWIYARYVLPPFARLSMLTWQAILFGIVMSVAVQIGDLAESLIKRDAKVKDSSQLIPGHGGMLDRIDSLLFAIPVAYLVLTFPHMFFPVNR
ncbi:MAG TPA: phosphatidate cytidylyltransferase [Gemmatimonadaceae bacterium]|nr:phosphatidate cytidylyltransferase [Gemmatimonadaceae bacterium]